MALNDYGDEKNPYLRANSLNELLDWHDVNFIRCAYVTVLGRQPDRNGERNYLDELRAGRSRLDILRQLRRSAEGRKFDPGIAGLDRALRRAAWGRLPVLGWFARFMSRSAEGDSRRDRQFRALLNNVAQTRIYVTGSASSSISDQISSVAMAGQGGPQRSTRTRQILRPPELEHRTIKAPLQRYFLERAE